MVMTGYEIGALAIGGASMLNSAFGGGVSSAKASKLRREALQTQWKYGEPMRQKANAYDWKKYGSMKAKVRDARKAGLHPLFALGNSGYNPPGTMASAQPGANFIPGQSTKGSFASDGLDSMASIVLDIGRMNAMRDLVDSQAKLAAEAKAAQSVQPDTLQGVTDQMVSTGRPVVLTPVKEFSPGKSSAIALTPAEQFTTKKDNRSVHAADMAMKRKLWVTDDRFIWIPNVQELDSLMEEPLTAATIIAAMNPELTLNQVKQIMGGQGFQKAAKQKGRTKKWSSWGDLIRIYKRE